MRSIVFEDNSNSPGYWIYTLIIATYCVNKRGFDCALPCALSLRQFFSFPSSILLSFSSYYPSSFPFFFFFFSCTASGLEPLTFPIPLAYESLWYTTTLRSSVEICPLVCIAKNLHYNVIACCTLHENMHCISCGANTLGQVQLWQNDVHVHSRSLHRRRLGFRRHLPRNQSLLFYCGQYAERHIHATRQRGSALNSTIYYSKKQIDVSF